MRVFSDAFGFPDRLGGAGVVFVGADFAEQGLQRDLSAGYNTRVDER